MRPRLVVLTIITALSTPAWAGFHWDRMPGTLYNLTVANGNNVWGSNGSNRVYRWNDSTGAWSERECCMRQVSRAPDGTTWGVSEEDRPYRWNGASWIKVTGGMHYIDVGNKDEIWGTNAAQKVYRWTGSDWEQMPGSLSRVSVGSDGTVWGVNGSNQIYRWMGSSWQQISGSLKQISVGSGHYIWGVNASNEIFRWNGASWDRVSGSLAWLSVGDDGVVWGVNADHEVFRLRELSPASTSSLAITTPLGGPLNLAALSQSLLSPTTCWIGTGTRGIGEVPQNCGAGKVKDGGLCYEACDSDYDGIGPVCWGDCPSGYTNTGLLCTYSGSLLRECNWSGPWYDRQCNCPANYVDAGLLCAANTRQRPSYGRGVGSMPTCPDGKDYDAGLCYNDCPNSNSVAVGPICWNNCPSDFPVPCGAMCATSVAECGLATADILVSTASVALNIATLGASSTATSQARLATQASATTIGDGVDAARLAEDGADYTLDGYGAGATVAGNVNGVDPVQLQLELAAMTDPTGLLGLAMSLAKPVCGKSPPAAVALSGSFVPGVGTTQYCAGTARIEYQRSGEPKRTVWVGTFDGDTTGLPTEPPLAYLAIRPLVLNAGGTFTITRTITPCGESATTDTATCTNVNKGQIPNCNRLWAKLKLDQNTGILTMKIKDGN